jgi:hypothetical protein
MSLVKAAVFAAAFSLCAPAVMAEEATQHAQSVTSAPEATLQDGAFVFHDPRLDADLNATPSRAWIST